MSRCGNVYELLKLPLLELYILELQSSLSFTTFNPTACHITYKAAKKPSLFNAFTFVISAPSTVTPTETGDPAEAKSELAESLESASKPNVEFTDSGE